MRILIGFLLLLLSGGSLKAQPSLFTIGGGIGQLKITVYTNRTFYVERESSPGSNIWQKQFYSKAPLFAIKIDPSTYYSVSDFVTESSSTNIVGTRGEYSVTYSRMHNAQPFSVTIKIIYDTSNPDYFILESTIDATAITSGEPISFAYGYDSYVNNCDGGVAWVLPDLGGYNGGIDASIHLTATDVQALRFVGSVNNNGVRSLMGFFPVERPFSQVYSAHYTAAYASDVIKTTSNNLCRFGPTAVPCTIGGGWDSGVGVVYNNIPSGEKTTISTGLTFTTSIDGTLDYLWDGVKDKTIAIGSTATLNLAYTSLSPMPLAGIAFQANFPGLNITGGCSTTGFTSGTETCTVGDSHYTFTNGTINAQKKGYINVPIQATQYGQWVVSASSITNTAKTIPTGTPATLTVATDVNIASISKTTICSGESATVAVKLDGTTTTSQPITVAIDYTGSTATASDYSARPTTITIPANQNSATFTIVSTAAAEGGHTFNFRLASTDKAFATIGSSSAGVVTIKPKPTLTGTLTPAAICSGSTFGYTATSAVIGTTFTWARATVTGISNAAASGSGATVSEVLVNTTSAPINVIYTFTLTNGSCSNTQSITVSVLPSPTLSSTLTPTAICSGSTFGYTATSTTGASFSWTRAAVAGISNTAASGSNATIGETLVNTTSAPIDVTYTFTLTLAGCTKTQDVVVSVKPTPTLSSTPTPTAVCSGNTFNYSATSFTSGTNFSWTRTAVTGISNAAASGSSATISEVLVNTTTTPINVIYTFTLTAGGCSNTQNVTVSIVPSSPTLSSTLIPAAVCSGSTFGYTATSATGGIDFSWARAAVAGNAAASGSGSTISEVLVNTTSTPVNVTYTFTLAVGSCSNTQNVTVTVLPSPTLSSTLTPAAVCSGSTFGYTATSTTGGVSFSWARAAVAGNAAASGSGTTISETLGNNTNAPISVIYTFTLTNGSCSSTQNVTVSVTPPPTLSSTLTPAAVCSGSTFGYTATSAASGISFSWARAAVAGNAAASGSGTTISEVLVNTTTTPIDAIYTITMSAGAGCTNTQNVTVSIKPIPVLTSPLTPAAVCSGSTFSYTPTSSLSGTTYTWVRPIIVGINNDACSGHSKINDEKLINTTSAAVNATYTITLNANGCSNTQNITTSIKPSPALDFNAAGKLVCYNEAPVIELSNLNSADTYTVYDESKSNKLTTVHGVSAKVVTLNLKQQQSTTYHVEVTDNAGCSSSSMASVKLNTVELAISPTTLPFYVKGEEYNQLLTTNGVSPLFSIANGQLPTGLSLSSNGQLHGQAGITADFGLPFSIQVKDINGCTAVQAYQIDRELFIPEIFSPNGDGINDYFMKGYHVVIFDRLGVKLFEGNDGWDGTYRGKVMPNDTYFYVLLTKDKDEKEVRKVGHIIIFKR